MSAYYINTVVLDSGGKLVSGVENGVCGQFNLSLSTKGETYHRDKKCISEVSRFKDELRRLISGEVDIITHTVQCPAFNRKKLSFLLGVPVESGLPRGVALVHINVEDMKDVSIDTIGTLAMQLNRMAKDAITDQLYELTKRQKEVLEGIVRGHSNKEIANDIGISYETVKVHVSGILRRLNVKNRTEAALFAVTTNICDHPPELVIDQIVS